MMDKKSNYLEIQRMSAKTDLVDLFLSKVARKTQRDYWQIEGFECFTATGCAALIQGRRRTSEAFWPGQRLDWPTLHAFSIAIHNAVTIANILSENQGQITDCVFPETEIMALCLGSQYVIEMSETLNGFGKKSICTTVFSLGQPMLPTVQLIEEELDQFSQDIEALLEQLTAAQASTTP